MIFEDVSTGAHNDLERSSEIARGMVMDYGMSRLGRVTYRENARNPFLATAGDGHSRLYSHSEQTAREIDEEVRRIIDECYTRAKQVILDHRDKLIALAEALLEYETLDFTEISEILDTGKLTNPPKRPTGLTSTKPPEPPPIPEPVQDKSSEVAPGADPAPAGA